MFRGLLIGLLALLLLGPPLSFAQSVPSPPSSPSSPLPVLPDAAPIDGVSEPHDGPTPGILGPAYFQEGSAYPYLWWARAELLGWWIKNSPAPPPLVTTGPATAASPAVLGQPGTKVLFGDQPVDFGTSAGGRWTLGTWCDSCQHSGFEITGLVLNPPPQMPVAFSNSAGTPILGRPFVAVPNGGPITDYVSFPNRFAGSVNVASNSGLWGLEGLYVYNWVPWREYGRGSPYRGAYRVDLLAGCRHLDLLEDLSVNQTSTVLAGGVADFERATILPPNTIMVNDRFQTRNQFTGGEVGARAEFVRGAFFLDCSGKLAVGGTWETVIVNGASTLLPPPGLGPPNVVAGGLLATATNIGRRSRDQFTVVPELGINVGFQLWEQFRIYVGYTFIYWSDVARPGNQIDPVVNVTQVPIHPDFGPLVGPARPAPLFQQSTFWTQGLNLGVELRF